MKRFRKIMLIATAICSLAATGQKTIVQRECWLDGNIAASQTMTEGTMMIDISSLRPGLHTFAMRVQDSEGLWSSSVTRLLFVPEASSGAALVNYQYWLDNDYQHAVIVPSSTNHGVFSIDISSLNEGFHSFAIRVQNSDGKWSSTVTRFFLKPATPTDATIVRCRYWFDDDVDHAVVVPLDGNSGILSVDVNRLTRGEHTLSWMVGDSKGTWSEETKETFMAPGPLGDLDGNNVVDIEDVTALISFILNGASNAPSNCDMNQDGRLDIEDVTRMIVLVLGNN